MDTRFNHLRLARLFILISLLLVVVAPLVAQDVQPGIDIWTTPGQGTSSQDFSANPIPADFFEPGSDPFDGVITLEGFPLWDLSGPPGPLPFDTVVERLTPAILPAIGSEDTVGIQVMALSLVSAGPITITYNGGQNPELWDINVCLSQSIPQPQGTMTIRQTCAEGGTYDSQLLVQPQLVFVRQMDGQVTILDDISLGLTLVTTDGRWVYAADPSLAIIQVAPGILTDVNCDGSPEPPFVVGSSNFVPGVWQLSCESSCVEPPPAEPQRARLTTGEHANAELGLVPAQQAFPDGDIDGFPDPVDNCIGDFNPLQEDSDDDSLGDLCDNCSSTSNACQEDQDINGIGDHCEDLIFGDGFESNDTSAWSSTLP